MEIAIIIPTLCRYSHLLRCVSSLKNNSRANEVDLIIGLDYPPSEKYKEGYSKIKENFKDVQGFRNYILLESDYNLGAEENEQKLKKYVYEHNYDGFIFSEDDNEFSPNYIDYIIKGLIISEETNIEFVSGYTHLDMQVDQNYSQNIFVSKAFSAWGYGVLLKNHTSYDKYRDFYKIGKILKNKELCKKINNAKPGAVKSLMGMLKFHEVVGDTLHSIYMIVEDKYCLFPVVSKVRNYGTDGTGVHSVKINYSQLNSLINQSIDSNMVFEPSTDNIKSDLSYFDRKRAIEVPHSLIEIVKYIIFRFDLLLYRLTGITIPSRYL